MIEAVSTARGEQTHIAQPGAQLTLCGRQVYGRLQGMPIDPGSAYLCARCRSVAEKIAG